MKTINNFPDLGKYFNTFKKPIMAQPFNHNFIYSAGVINIAGINGYTKALSEIQRHIAEVTKWKPENRLIDSVALLERITATLEALTPLMNHAANELQESLPNNINA